MLDMERGTAKWSYCSVCRQNHDEGRPHIFTTQHKTALATILGKFSKKVGYFQLMHTFTDLPRHQLLPLTTPTMGRGESGQMPMSFHIANQQLGSWLSGWERNWEYVYMYM